MLRDNLSDPIFKGRSSSRFLGPLMMGPISCTETSVWNYYTTLSKIPDERRSQILILPLLLLLFLLLLLLLHLLLLLLLLYISVLLNDFVDR